MTRRHTILVVDDEPDVVQSLHDLLRLQYRVFGATRADDGIKILQEQEIHVVMTDQRMPGMTGVEFLHRVRGDYPEAIRLLFTGYADIKAVIDAINQGNVYRYITKPPDPDELLLVLRQACEQYDLLVERRKLLAELQVRNDELQRANAELKKSNELKECFIRVASHELRTPLTILLGLSELAVTHPKLPAQLQDWLTHMHGASVRLDQLTNQLFQMLTAGKFERELTRQPIDVAKLVEAAVEDVRPFIKLRRQELTVNVAPDAGTIPVEASKIRDGIAHLLLNAIKFTPDGGAIRVTVRPTEGNQIALSVQDSGQGIEPACLVHVFDAFFTSFDVSRHSSGQYEFGRRGLGVGLSLVKAFTEMHGGKVTAASEVGKGSTFTITLPRGVAEGSAPYTI
jgi:signal transduction histidine kinase